MGDPLGWIALQRIPTPFMGRNRVAAFGAKDAPQPVPIGHPPIIQLFRQEQPDEAAGIRFISCRSNWCFPHTL